MSVLSPEVKTSLDSFLSEVPEFRVILIQLFEDYMIQTEEPKAADLPLPESVKYEAGAISPQSVKREAGAFSPQSVKREAGAFSPQSVKREASAFSPQSVKREAGAFSPESVKREAGAFSPQPAPAEMPAEGNAESDDDFY